MSNVHFFDAGGDPRARVHPVNSDQLRIYSPAPVFTAQQISTEKFLSQF
jgi:hypothetical protein